MVNGSVVDVAYGRAAAEVVVTGGRLVNVLTGEIYEADVAIVGSRIAAVGDVRSRCDGDTEVIDAAGRYLTPGLIDGHLRLECSKLSVTMFADLVARFGTTNAVSGLDQVLIVAGLEGVREFLTEAERSALRIFWGAPAKAPYTMPESTVGHRFGPAEHRIAQTWPECVGLWETVQEFIEQGDDEVREALEMAERNRLPIFGCAPMSDGRRIAGLAAAGVRLDHESYSAEEALEKLRNGIHVIIREPAAAPFLEENIRVLTEFGVAPGRVAFCTDDVSASDLLGQGHLDRLVRMAVDAGVGPMTAIQMVTTNCASMYRIDQSVGAIAPGRFADILLVDDLADFRAQTVLSGGRVVAGDEASRGQPVLPERSPLLRDTIVLSEVTGDDMALAINEITGAGGGQVVVSDGEVVDLLPLPLGGIVAGVLPEQMAEREQALDRHAHDLGSSLPSPFGYLIFLSITAIPEYAITDLGLIDCVNLKPVDPLAEPVGTSQEGNQ